MTKISESKRVASPAAVGTLKNSTMPYRNSHLYAAVGAVDPEPFTSAVKKRRLPTAKGAR